MIFKEQYACEKIIKREEEQHKRKGDKKSAVDLSMSYISDGDIEPENNYKDEPK